MLLLTLATEEANFNLTNPNPDNFRIVVSFKPTQPTGVVASGFVDVMETKSEWEVSSSWRSWRRVVKER